MPGCEKDLLTCQRSRNGMFCSVAGSCGPSVGGAAEAAGRSRISGVGSGFTSRPEPATGISSSCSSPTRGSRTNWKPSAMAWWRSMGPSRTESRLSWPSRSWVQLRLRLMPGARQTPWPASPQACSPVPHLPRQAADRCRGLPPGGRGAGSHEVLVLVVAMGKRQRNAGYRQAAQR